jgi:chromosomal replication initiation ATPase DnaA
MTPALDIFRRAYAESESVAVAIEAVFMAGRASDPDAARQRKREQLEFVFLAACESVGVEPDLVRSSSRHRRACELRRAVWRYMRNRGCSLPEIGLATGRRDHTAVMQGLRK